MPYFPLCIDLREKTVILVGSGVQAADKKEKLAAFGARIVQFDNFADGAWNIFGKDSQPALVVVGDTEPAEAEHISILCRERNIPVNVVDVPRLSTFFFPSMIVKGDLTVSVSTGGKSPAAAAYVRRSIEVQIPDKTEEILEWLHAHRAEFRQKGILKEITAEAFGLGRILSEEECDRISRVG